MYDMEHPTGSSCLVEKERKIARAMIAAKIAVRKVSGEQYQALRGRLRLVDIEPVTSFLSFFSLVLVASVVVFVACDLFKDLLVFLGPGDLSPEWFDWSILLRALLRPSGTSTDNVFVSFLWVLSVL